MRNDLVTTQSYDTFASQYAKRWGKQWRETDGNLIKKLLTLVKPKAKILDVGCGTGDLLKFLIDDGFKGYGIDSSAGMLEEAKKHIASDYLQQMDICNLNYPNGYFDAVISLYALQHIQDVEKALYELKRVTKRNGYVYLGTHIGSKNNDQETWYSFPDNGGKVYMHYWSEEQIARLIEEYELEIIEKSLTPLEKEKQNIHLILAKR